MIQRVIAGRSFNLKPNPSVTIHLIYSRIATLGGIIRFVESYFTLDAMDKLLKNKMVLLILSMADGFLT